MTDSDRESLIDAALEQLIAATSEAAKRAHWADLVYHVKLRSPEQIFKMEAERRISSQYAPLVTYQMGDVEEHENDTHRVKLEYLGGGSGAVNITVTPK